MQHGEGRLLEPEVGNFWTEHSDRAGVDSWLAALGVDKDLRGFVGRWAISTSQDLYVRTAMRVVENMQILAARHARASFNGGPDFFGEEHLLLQLEAFLAGRVPSDKLAAQMSRLKVSDFSMLPTPLGKLDKSGALEFEEEMEPAAGDGVPVGEPVELEASVEELPALEISAAVIDQEQALALDLAPPIGFVTAITKSGRTPAVRRLHFVGAC